MTCTSCGRTTDWLWGEGWSRDSAGERVWLVEPGEALCIGCHHQRQQQRPTPTLRDLNDQARRLARL